MSESAGDGRLVTRPVPLRETVRATLEDMIVHGALEVGEHLREERLAERPGVSRQPVREALLHLARDGRLIAGEIVIACIGLDHGDGSKLGYRSAWASPANRPETAII
jgi:hypothetical protein